MIRVAAHYRAVCQRDSLGNPKDQKYRTATNAHLRRNVLVSTGLLWVAGGSPQSTVGSDSTFWATSGYSKKSCAHHCRTLGSGRCPSESQMNDYQTIKFSAVTEVFVVTSPT